MKDHICGNPNALYCASCDGKETRALQARIADLESAPNPVLGLLGKFKDENARLRKALELIAKPNLSLADSDGLHRQEIAEKALREPDGEKNE